MNEGINIRYIKGIIRRRIKVFLLFCIPIFTIVVTAAFLLPPIYVSKSKILIESQSIPQEYVRATIGGYVEERLQVITQQIMSRSRLVEIIRKFNLYPDMREKYGVDVIIEKMRKDIDLKTIQSRRGRRGTGTTVAFTLSYEGRDPSTTQKVANVLASLYIEENLRKRGEQAVRTTRFLQEELDHLQEKINEYGNKIIEFKKAHLGELPENEATNIRAMDRLSQNLDRVEMQIRSLKERKIYIEQQILNLDLHGKTGDPKQRLKDLRRQLIALQFNLSEKHPDIIKLNREISELETLLKESKDSPDEKRLIDLKGRLVAMKSRLGPHHPDVVKLSRKVDNFSRKIKNTKKDKQASDLTQEKPENPTYYSLKGQIGSLNLEINNYLYEKRRIKKKIDYYQNRIEKGLVVEKEYSYLLRDYEHFKKKYNEIMSKQMEARVALEMEETQHGEHFTIIEPAIIPSTPEKPDRPKIMLIGLFLAICAGGGLAVTREGLDHSIKTESELRSILHIPVLSVIPLMESDEEKLRKRRKKIIWILTAIIAISAAVTTIHFFVIPLDILWIKMHRWVTIYMKL